VLDNNAHFASFLQQCTIHTHYFIHISQVYYDPPFTIGTFVNEYHALHKLQAVNQPTSLVSVMAQSSNPIAFFLVLLLWTLDTCILRLFSPQSSKPYSCNQSYFSSFTFLDSLPFVTHANGSQIKVWTSDRPSSSTFLRI